MSLTRLRWRLRGAWLWPSFLVLSLADATIIHALPPAGDSVTWVGGWLLASVLNLLAIVLLGRAGGQVVRRLRGDMPAVVARNYAGALLTLAITLAFLAAGLVNQGTVRADRAALADAAARAEAYIGEHAPASFQADVRRLDTYVMQEPLIYRFCASDVSGSRDYCVVVNRSQPFGRSVHYSGTEPNWLLAEGSG